MQPYKSRLAVATLAMAMIAVVACSSDGPVAKAKPDVPRFTKAPTLRKLSTKFDPDVIVLEQIPVTGTRTFLGSCDWTGVAAEAVRLYSEKHPGKVPGRSASLSDYDEDTCEGKVSITIIPPGREAPSHVDTTTIHYPSGKPISEASLNRVNRLAVANLDLNDEVGGIPAPQTPPNNTSGEWYCYNALNQANNDFIVNSKQDLIINGTTTRRMSTQVTTWARRYTTNNPSGHACVRLDSTKVIRAAFSYYVLMPLAEPDSGIVIEWFPGGHGWSWCVTGNTNSCLVESYASAWTRFYKPCKDQDTGAPQAAYILYFGYPNDHSDPMNGYSGRFRSDGVAQVASWGGRYGFGGPSLTTCWTNILSGPETLTYHVVF